MLYSLLKPLLFKINPETIHHLALTLSELYQGSPYSFSPSLHSSLRSLQSPSPIGLAAGFDKNAQALNTLANLGFGMLEAGTVTLREQLGNPVPRLWRYPDELSLRNAMGFPNGGASLVEKNMSNYNSSSLLGINLGKNKESSAQESIEELGEMSSRFKSCDYFTINVSSPNTPGLRVLQEPSYLRELFKHLQSKTNKPLFLKIAPDLEKQKIIELATLSEELKLEGIIATNTTIMEDRGIGGVSGRLLKNKASEVHKTLLEMNTDLTIIGVGGIENFNDVLRFWKLGGAWVQIYTALIYQGPGLINKINHDILNFLDSSDLKDLDTFFKLELSMRQKIIGEYEKKLS